MVQVEDMNLEPNEGKIHDYCYFCHSPIYKGEQWYVGLEVEACEDCKTDFLIYHRRVAE